MAIRNNKLTIREAARFRKYCDGNGGQEVVAVSLYTSSSRISRIIQRKCAPQKMFRHILLDLGIIKK